VAIVFSETHKMPSDEDVAKMLAEITCGVSFCVFAVKKVYV